MKRYKNWVIDSIHLVDWRIEQKTGINAIYWHNQKEMEEQAVILINIAVI